MVYSGKYYFETVSANQIICFVDKIYFVYSMMVD